MKHFTALWTLDSACANTVIYTTLNLITRSSSSSSIGRRGSQCGISQVA